MGMIDSFKSLGFDHKRHKSQDAFIAHWNALDSQNLKWRVLEDVEHLKKLEVLNEDIFSKDENIKFSLRKLYTRFYKFWCDAIEHLSSPNIARAVRIHRLFRVGSCVRCCLRAGIGNLFEISNATLG